MKKILLTSLCLMAFGASQAQTNLGFETWTGQDPDGWQLTSNVVTVGGGPVTLTKETALPATGVNSAKLTVAACIPCAVSGLFPNPMVGFVVQGSSVTGTLPTSVTFKWRGNIAANDTGIIGGRLSQGTTVSSGTAFFEVPPSTNQTTWLTQTVNFTMIPGAPAPDTLIVGAAADSYMLTVTDGDYSGHSTSTSTVLYVDDFVVSFPSGIGLLETDNNLIMAYPNPSYDMVNFNLLGTDASMMEIVDVTGQLVYSQNNLDMKFKLDVSAYKNGVYFARFLNNKKQYIGTARFNVAK